jgi:hypothetical protein
MELKFFFYIFNIYFSFLPLDKLNTVQRKGLSIILGLPSTANLEAMEVMSGVIPLDLRREEIAIRDIGLACKPWN